MKISSLQYITNGQTADEIYKEVEEVINAGVDWVQLRIKNPDMDFLTIARRVKELCNDKAVLIVNDKVDIAHRIDADGVHLGQGDMNISDARKMLGSKRIIGGTANTIEQCEQVIKDGADYIGLGPFRFTKTKKELSPELGLEGYELMVKDAMKIPVIAIGGLTTDDVRDLKAQSKVHGVAISGFIFRAENKRSVVEDLKEILYGKVENS